MHFRIRCPDSRGDFVWKTVEALVAEGVNPNVTNAEGLTALHTVCIALLLLLCYHDGGCGVFRAVLKDPSKWRVRS